MIKVYALYQWNQNVLSLTYPTKLHDFIIELIEITSLCEDIKHVKLKTSDERPCNIYKDKELQPKIVNTKPCF